MTSTTTHSSHTSHSNTPHSNHGNSVSTTPTYTYNSHTATLGGVDWSGSVPNTTPLATYGGSGSLTNLLSVVNSMRNRYASSSYIDNASSYSYKTTAAAPATGSAITPANLTTLMNRAGATLKARYNAITATADITTNDTHANSSGTSTQLAAGTAINVHSNTIPSSPYTGGESYHLNTGSRTGYAAPVKNEVEVNPSFSPSTGDRITKAHLTNILNQLKNNTLVKWTGPSGDPGTWRLIGTNTFHGSHSSHASHASCSKEVKTDINSIKISALNLIKNLDLVEFKYTPEIWKTDPDADISIKHYGFIAENAPEELATQYHDRMDYINCIGLLLKAIQELDNKIDTLKVEHN